MRWLKRISSAWDDFQASRARDAVYGYLEAVFAIVEHYKMRRKTKKLLRHAFRSAGLSFDRNVDPFTAVIRCTSEDIDSKTVSKWARALRYVTYARAAPLLPDRLLADFEGTEGSCVTQETCMGPGPKLGKRPYKRKRNGKRSTCRSRRT